MSGAPVVPIVGGELAEARLARFLAGLMYEGVKFEVIKTENGYEVTLFGR